MERFLRRRPGRSARGDRARGRHGAARAAEAARLPGAQRIGPARGGGAGTETPDRRGHRERGRCTRRRRGRRNRRDPQGPGARELAHLGGQPRLPRAGARRQPEARRPARGQPRAARARLAARAADRGFRRRHRRGRGRCRPRGRRRPAGRGQHAHAQYARRPRRRHLRGATDLGGRRGARRGGGRRDDQPDRVAAQPRAGAAAGGDAGRVRAGRGAAAVVRDAHLEPHPPPERRGRSGDRRARARDAPDHRVGRERRDRRPVAQLHHRARAPGALQRLPGGPRGAPVARTAHPGGGGALVAGEPARGAHAGRDAHLRRARRGGPGAARHHPFAHDRGEPPGAGAVRRRARALRRRGGGARLRRGLPPGLWEPRSFRSFGAVRAGAGARRCRPVRADARQARRERGGFRGRRTTCAFC